MDFIRPLVMTELCFHSIDKIVHEFERRIVQSVRPVDPGIRPIHYENEGTNLPLRT